MEQLLNLNTPAPLRLDTLAINMLLSIVLASALAWFYTKYGKSLSNRAKFANTLPVLALVTVLIISIVKSSLALSLGLVGALSIVRFRTAIKEPEELIYLFTSIAIGLGLGADQRWPTVVAIVIILGYLYVRTLLTPQVRKNNLFFSLSTPDEDSTFTAINNLLNEHTNAADLRRLDHHDGTLQATYLINCEDDAALAQLLDALKDQQPDAEFSFVEQDNTLGV
ncbi:MAG: DUF4956 domain-containing protein [Chloroflexota bacterium]